MLILLANSYIYIYIFFFSQREEKYVDKKMYILLNLYG